MALPIFAITLFISAFLLFLVQPMIGKMILPNLGGTPQVWNTCMVFFQTALLLGYAYTHVVSTRLKLRTQFLVHGIVLLLPLAILLTGTFYTKIKPWFPPPGANPIWQTLFLLSTVVGVPFFVVATSAPLLQRWFASTGHPAGKDPYFLYGASNLGSFLSLIAYPFIIEPNLLLQEQSWVWAVGYVLLAALVFFCMGMVLKAPPSVEVAVKEESPAVAVKEEVRQETHVAAGAPTRGGKTSFKKGSKQARKAAARQQQSVATREAPPPPLVKTPSRLDEVTPFRRLRWVLLAAVPSSLMLGVTTYITTDLSPIPLLWLIPLMLYLISFVLVFARWPVVWVETPHKVMVYAQPFALALLILALALHGFGNLWLNIGVHILAFFLTTMVCHGELAKDRPSTKHLTEFYLMMSVGGMLGGMFNALIAPIWFDYVWEYPIAIFVAGLLRPTLVQTSWLDEWFENTFGKSGATPGGRPGKGAAQATTNSAQIMDVAIPIVLLVVMVVVIIAASGALGGLFAGMAGGDAESGRLLAFAVSLSVFLVISLFFFGRPLRYGLTIGALLLVINIQELRGSQSIYADRSYFGVLNVKESVMGVPVGNQRITTAYTQLLHGTTNHGMNFYRPADEKLWGNPDADFSRLATTYYHREGPAGVVMQLFDWFPGPANTYWADNRMPASLVGLGASPTSALVGLWSEPPFATIGLGTGTMASYARPLQHMHYYEIDDKIVQLSIPPTVGQEPYFTYLRGAKQRGAELWVLMGDARQRMAMPYPWPEKRFDIVLQPVAYDKIDEAAKILDEISDDLNFKLARSLVEQAPTTVVDTVSEEVANRMAGQLREQFQSRLGLSPEEAETRITVVEAKTKPWNEEELARYHDNQYGINVIDGDSGGGPENFYHMMVVDAFSSDAIPVHLITKQAIQMYFKKLVEEGILCVHVSNRYVDLVPIVMSVADSLGFYAVRCHDSAPPSGPRGEQTLRDVGHFTSEWVLVARKREYITDRPIPMQGTYLTSMPPNYDELAKAQSSRKGVRYEPYWMDAPEMQRTYHKSYIEPRYIWTDDYSNLMAVLR